jgi:hypothetical protein
MAGESDADEDTATAVRGKRLIEPRTQYAAAAAYFVRGS